MTILVTGGAGFIGSNFLLYLHKIYPQAHLVCIDKLTYAGNLSNLSSVLMLENFSFFQCDICDVSAVEQVFALEQPELVVNFAAESHVDRSIHDPNVFLQTNVFGTQVLMDACLRHNVKRFHQVSTDEVYGDLPLDRPDLLFSEQTPLHPSSPYSASKASADLLVLAYHRTYGLCATVSRCSNNYGPYQFPEKLIPLMIANAVENKPLPVYGQGLNIRDWLHVQDHCRAIDMILQNGSAGEVYNIGGNAEMCNIDIVKLICKIIGCGEELITYVPDRAGHDLRYAIDATKIKTELGWEPSVSFSDGIRETVYWYTQHNAWWQLIRSGEYAKQNSKILQMLQEGRIRHE